VWRERAFEVVLDEAWITGIFDRVVVERDAAGRARAATVFDFKTDALDGAADAALAHAAARHAAQLGLYRRAAARLAGLPAEAVRAEVVFTGPGRRRAVE
jgi:ATP-dependent helicase/nuclease subunit A